MNTRRPTLLLSFTLLAVGLLSVALALIDPAWNDETYAVVRPLP